MNNIRIWDLPTRLFHWALAVSVIGLVVTAKVGGDAMNWHFRLGYTVFTLLLFRLVWGLVGGHWSRFMTFFPTPGRLKRYLSGQATEAEQAGHNPLGALSVLAMLLVLALQVASGLVSDDEIAFAGPLTPLVSGAVVSQASSYHKSVGQYLVIGLVLLHLLAIVIYTVRRRGLVQPMLTGDRAFASSAAVTAARDGIGTRLLALVVLTLSAGVVYGVLQLGASAVLG
ncbi:MAG: cytochrome b/b6 domain-containing protein [Proteobacteria bacterium]|jgi:cytochrome b|nr:cytochrome b/b6 domain-containing protein [Pseudomonadota bacterium]